MRALVLLLALTLAACSSSPIPENTGVYYRDGQVHTAIGGTDVAVWDSSPATPGIVIGNEWCGCEPGIYNTQHTAIGFVTSGTQPFTFNDSKRLVFND